ncbi:cytochrome P460 family protein, partial [Caballeronia sp.]|uniref:cytochrome P460 family protein n=1 Tax=Caballeronia sp. TaxID=1931223 RepID=UPI003C64B8FB
PQFERYDMKLRYPLSVAILITTLFAMNAMYGASSHKEPAVARASFRPDGQIVLPVGYRQWQHVGTRYKPDGLKILDGLPAKTPEVLNAYVQPSAFEIFEKSGQWPDGTQIVKEFSAVEVGAGCDGNTHVCTNDLGRGLYESHFNGLGMMVKDARRFPSAPGHWGYFSFGHKPPPYDAVATVSLRASCSSCHERLATDTDYVISRAHIGLDDGQKLRLPLHDSKPTP